MSTLLEVLSHIAPVVITLFLLATVLAWRTARPYLKYTALVAHADTDAGVTALAKHLARETGGKAINVDSAWQQFVPAAMELNQVHREKKEKLTSQDEKAAAQA